MNGTAFPMACTGPPCSPPTRPRWIMKNLPLDSQTAARPAHVPPGHAAARLHTAPRLHIAASTGSIPPSFSLRQPARALPRSLALGALVLSASLAGDCESVAQALLQVARNDLMTRDLSLGAIRRALQALVAHYPVYRTYFNACGRPAEDEAFFQQALADARQDLSEADWPLLEQLEKWLGGEGWRQLPPGRTRKQLRHACVRFQQLTAPSAAKAVEDTAFYRSARLLSRNDVGFEAERFSAPLEHFHNEAQHACGTSRTTCWLPPPTTTSAVKTHALAWLC